MDQGRLVELAEEEQRLEEENGHAADEPAVGMCGMVVRQGKTYWSSYILVLKNWKIGWTGQTHIFNYCKVSNIRRTVVGNKIVDHPDVVGASPVGAAPTKFSLRN